MGTGTPPPTSSTSRTAPWPPGARCRRAKCRLDGLLAPHEPVHGGVDVVGARLATPRSAPKVVSAHQRVVASLEAGLATRATINARARSRSAQAGPSRAARPRRSAIAHTAATWPCGKLRSISQPSPATTWLLPARAWRTSSITSAGRCDKLASVSFLTLPSSRNDRRSKYGLVHLVLVLATGGRHVHSPSSSSHKDILSPVHHESRILVSTF